MLLFEGVLLTVIRPSSCSVFNDGFPNVFVRDALDIRNRHVAFLCSFHEPAVIFEQISVIYALPRLFISSFTLVLPFFPTGTLERVRHHFPCSFLTIHRLTFITWLMSMLRV
jgi:hypothetical protein